MATAAWQGVDLRDLAARVGTPFYLYDAQLLRARIAAIRDLTDAPGLQARYAMKACSAAQVLSAMREQGIWIDAVSGNEVLRAQAAGYAMGADVPEVMLSTDVFRDNALEVISRHQRAAQSRLAGHGAPTRRGRLPRPHCPAPQSRASGTGTCRAATPAGPVPSTAYGRTRRCRRPSTPRGRA